MTRRPYIPVEVKAATIWTLLEQYVGLSKHELGELAEYTPSQVTAGLDLLRHTLRVHYDKPLVCERVAPFRYSIPDTYEEVIPNERNRMKDMLTRLRTRVVQTEKIIGTFPEATPDFILLQSMLDTTTKLISKVVTELATIEAA